MSDSGKMQEDRLWIEIVAIYLFGVLKQHFFGIVFWSIAACIGYVVFDKLTVPIIHPYYKGWLGFESLLHEMRIELERGIPADKQENHRVLKAYLDLYTAFRELRLAAKRDHNDKIDHRERKWSRFDRIRIPEQKKTNRE